MTDHYAEAVRLLEEAKTGAPEDEWDALVRLAQVHATLATVQRPVAPGKSGDHKKVQFIPNPDTGSYTIPVPKSATTGTFRTPGEARSGELIVGPKPNLGGIMSPNPHEWTIDNGHLLDSDGNHIVNLVELPGWPGRELADLRAIRQVMQSSGAQRLAAVEEINGPPGGSHEH